MKQPQICSPASHGPFTCNGDFLPVALHGGLMVVMSLPVIHSRGMHTAFADPAAVRKGKDWTGLWRLSVQAKSPDAHILIVLDYRYSVILKPVVHI
jgi:hypothetical protein